MTSGAKAKRLYHAYGETDESFFARVDECGGWPLGTRFVSFLHAIGDENRVCEFGNVELRDENWTTIASADDYYEWKLTPERRSEIRERARMDLITELRTRR